MGVEYNKISQSTMEKIIFRVMLMWLWKWQKPKHVKDCTESSLKEKKTHISMKTQPWNLWYQKFF